MVISNFFKNILNAKLNNDRNSWGAYNEDKSKLFLRIWADQIDESNSRVELYYENSTNISNGYKKRKEHLDFFQKNSIACYGVKCIPDSTQDGKRSIKSFDDETLFKLGSPFQIGHITYSNIISLDSVDVVINPENNSSTINGDINEINNSDRNPTTKKRLVEARMGQGSFRNNVLKQWGFKCSVTSARTSSAIIASHIVPWSDSDDYERLDPDNGLPLVATLDILFDRNLISFTEKGKIIISDRIDDSEKKRLCISDDMHLIQPLNEKQLYYLRQHILK